ncbi:MAG: glycoside hydrolase family 88 protein [Isosphaeraceae bacterium]|nr:glycoside hydrolase family 88 protein [Isosphaeraceae bacterium]
MDEPRAAAPDDLRPRLEAAFDFAAEQVRATTERTPDFFPTYTVGGRWKRGAELWTDWCGGFHAGMMWLIAERTGERRWYELAQHYSQLLEHRQHDRNVHDLGFIFLNTYRPWYGATGESRLNDVLVNAGRTLALRFNPKGRYLRSFVAPESLFIDIMMNVPIIFYAAREAGDPGLRAIAESHCRTTERTLVRPDGGTAHEGIFDLDTGEFVRQSTHQGLRADSDWSRGLAWSLYGFGTVYTYTQNPADLAVAERNADHFLARCPVGLIPPWDFDAPDGPHRIDDSSAAAIAASGLWDLSGLTADASRARRYRLASLIILDSLCSEQYLARGTPGWEGVLKHGVYHFHKQLGVDESVMWGDFFFLEAVAKVLGLRPCAGVPAGTSVL